MADRGDEARMVVRGLSKLPLGLLGFFGIKNGGEYPQAIGNTIIPQLDMAGLLQAAYIERFVGSYTLAATGFQAATYVAGGTGTVQVPQSETWALVASSFNIFTGAGDAFLGSPCIKSTQFGSSSNWIRLLRDPTNQAASLNTMNTTIVQALPLWMSPGDVLGFNVQTFTNASTTAQVTQHFGILRFLI